MAESEKTEDTEQTELPNPYKVSPDPIFPEIKEYKENTEETSTEEITEDVPEEESTENETETDMAVDIGSVLEAALHKRPADEGDYDTKRIWSFAKGIKPAIGVAVGAFIFLQLFPMAEMKFNGTELTVFFSIIFILVLIFAGFKRAKIIPDKTIVANSKQATEIENMKDKAQQNPGDADSLYQLGWAYEEAGRTEEAIAMYEKVLTVKSDYGEVWGMLGYNYFLKSDLQRAKEALNKAISLGEKGSVYLNAGHVHLVDYNEVKAIELYQMGLKTYPSPEEFFGDFDADYSLLANYGISKERYAKIRQQLQDINKD
ncbi:MAG: tetratricopeptide repeat protein [Bacteroidota bacterium]